MHGSVRWLLLPLLLLKVALLLPLNKLSLTLL